MKLIFNRQFYLHSSQDLLKFNNNFRPAIPVYRDWNEG